jgi:hypothetical protein
MMNRLMLVALLVFVPVLPIARAAEDARADLVEKLYKDFVWETRNPAAGRPGFIEQKRAVLEQYLTESLALLLLKDRACTARTHEICQLDFSPLWNSQDPEGAIFKVAAPGAGNAVLVTLTYPTDRPQVVTYELKQVAAGWRIDNIRTKEWSLRKILATQ